MDVTTLPVWLDGRIVDPAEATAPLMGPSLNYGWGVYEGIRFYPSADPRRPGPLGFRVPEHLYRLRNSARALAMTIPFTDDELLQACGDLVQNSGLSAGYLRPLVVLAPGEMSVAAQLDSVQVAIGCWEWHGYLPAAEFGIRARTSGWVRSGPNQLPPSVKSTGGYLNPSLARLEAVRSGDHEAIMLNRDGRVAEAAAANVFAVLDGTLVTPPLSEGILPGITRDTLLCLADELGIPACERPVAPAELRVASEVLLAGTAMELARVSVLDGLPIGGNGPGQVFTALRTAFDRVIHGLHAEHRDWVTDLSARHVELVPA